MTLARILAAAIETTPVCVIENGTLPNEKLIFSTLENISGEDINTPAIVIIGDVVKLYEDIYNY